MCAMDESRGVSSNIDSVVLSNEVVVIEGATFHQETLKPRQGEEDEEAQSQPFHGIFRRVPVNEVRIIYTFFSLLFFSEMIIYVVFPYMSYICSINIPQKVSKYKNILPPFLT